MFDWRVIARPGHLVLMYVFAMGSKVYISFYTLVKACSKGHFGTNCNDTCDGCISELCNSSDGVCAIQDLCKAGWHGVKCDKGTCIILYKYSWKSGKCINKLKKEQK